jgi:poly(A) polymerase
MVHRDNTFGTPEEDAFRRDFTINGLFYDIASFSVIDYVGGLEDLEKRVVRSIGDPRVRFVEDPVRMLRAAVMASRLDFELDPLVVEAIDEHRKLLATASPARLLEEYYKILRSGFAEATFRELGRLGLLEQVTPELKKPPAKVWESLRQVDRYRRQFPEAPPTLSNTVLIGALLGPLGLFDRAGAGARVERIVFGILPVARKDLERQQQIIQILPRLTDPDLPPRTARGLLNRPALPDALMALEIFGDAPEDLVRWQQARRQRAPSAADGHDGQDDGTPAVDEAVPARRRRRRRRRRGSGRGEKPPENS